MSLGGGGRLAAWCRIAASFSSFLVSAHNPANRLASSAIDRDKSLIDKGFSWLGKYFQKMLVISVDCDTMFSVVSTPLITWQASLACLFNLARHAPLLE